MPLNAKAAKLQRHRRRFHRWGMLSLILSLALLQACASALGPSYEEPPIDWADDWSSPSLTAIQRSAIANTPPIESMPSQWWKVFEDPVLDALIEAALQDNQNLRIAGLRVLESRAVLSGARASRAPQQIELTGSGGVGANAEDIDGLSDGDFRFGNAEFSIGWELDFWGRFQRAIEAGDALYLESIANFEDFTLLLTTEVARQYFSYRTQQARLVILDENAQLQRRSLDITQYRYEAGEDSELNVQQAKAQYLGTISARPTLEEDLAVADHALASLLGRASLMQPALASTASDLTTLPDTVAQGIPADLLRRRPDVRAASYRAAAASANVGIAKADLYPSLSLFGTLGLSESGSTELASASGGALLQWNILDFGLIRNNVRVQDARFEQSLANYEETVLQAAREVNDAAVRFEKVCEEIALLEESRDIARRAYEIALIHFQEGFSDFQRLLDAQETLLRQEDRLTSARGLKAIYLTQIYKAIAGAWISSSEIDYAPEATRQQMEERTHWGDLLELDRQPNPDGDDPLAEDK